MKELKVCNVFIECNENELSIGDAELVNRAREAAKNAYAPYSGFYVGAAALLDNGMIITGSNQENAAYPSGLCAERVALFSAVSNFRSNAITTIAIAAYNGLEFTAKPISPCGACRQVLLEYEKRQQTPIRIILYGKEAVYTASSALSLMPLCFDSSYLKNDADEL